MISPEIHESGISKSAMESLYKIQDRPPTN